MKLSKIVPLLSWELYIKIFRDSRVVSKDLEYLELLFWFVERGIKLKCLSCYCRILMKWISYIFLHVFVHTNCMKNISHLSQLPPSRYFFPYNGMIVTWNRVYSIWLIFMDNSEKKRKNFFVSLIDSDIPLLTEFKFVYLQKYV